MKNPVSSDQPAEAEEEEQLCDGVDFNEAMATMQNAVALTRDTSGARRWRCPWISGNFWLPLF